MKYAIMSDVHANPRALETALADARSKGCEKFVFAGDVTGYGYDVNVALRLGAGSRYIVNVGSVGNPRNDLCSSYAIYDSDAARVTIRRLPFDFRGYVAEMLAHEIDLPSWLCDLLQKTQEAEARNWTGVTP